MQVVPPRTGYDPRKAPAFSSPLGAHAPAWAKAQGRGAVVTAERDHGPWNYALGGEAFAAGHAAVAPERIEFEIGSISKVFTAALRSTAADLAKLADALAAGAGGPLEDVWPILTGDEVEAARLGRIGLALIHDRIDGQDVYGHPGGTSSPAADAPGLRDGEGPLRWKW